MWLDIDDAFNEAKNEGKFDNLPGTGKPFSFDELDALAGDQWAANHVLKNAGYAPKPIQMRRDIQEATELATRVIERAWAFTSRSRAMGYDALIEQRWAKSQQQFKNAIENINIVIRDLNISTTIQALQMAPLNADRMLENVMGVTHKP